jgi:hypothetical protein
MTNDQRRQNYQTLRAIGFTKEEANRLKGASEDKIWGIVQQRETMIKEIRSDWQKKQEKSGGLKYQTRDQVQERRRDNYKKLRDAGYSAKDANKLKGSQEIKTQYLIDKKQGKSIGSIHENIKKNLQKIGISAKDANQLKNVPVDQLQRIVTRVTEPGKRIDTKGYSKPRGIQYAPVSEADKKYLSNYTYKVSYQTKDKNGNKETKWITITSPDKMSKKAVKAEARDILSGDGGSYDFADVDSYADDDATILISTITVEEAYYNDL